MATFTIPTTASTPQTCAGCGSPLDEDQRYCLNCGTRAGDPRLSAEELLGRLGAGAAPPDATAGVAAASPAGAAAPRDWTPVVALGGLGLLALVLVVGVLIGRSSSGSGSAPAPVIVQGGGSSTTAPSATSGATFTSDWQDGRPGWTIELGTLPSSGTTPAQVAQAKSAATAKGLTGVGALDSAGFASLPSGEYVVYAGVYGSKAAARKALAKAKSAYPDATVVQVSGDAGGAGGSSGSSNAPAGKGATGGSYEKRSAKSPTTQSTGGGPPPAPDHKAPGGGSGGTSIG